MDSRDDAPDSPEWYARVEPLLRRLERTKRVKFAIDRIKTLSEEEWSPVTEAKIRCAALMILAEYVKARAGHSGMVPLAELKCRDRVEVALGLQVALTQPLPRDREPTLEDYHVADSLRSWLARDLEEAQRLETEAAERGVRLDPGGRGGGSLRTGRQGRMPTLLAEHVKSLLRERYPEWDGESEFPAPNNRELREWLAGRLRRSPWDATPLHWTSGLSWTDALGAYPYRPADVDPSNKGPLWSIINGLKNPKDARRLGSRK